MTATARARRCGALLSLLTALFALRVLGQAVQRWWPQPHLPPFESFQGSNLPYWLLLSAQIIILAALIVGIRHVLRGTPASPRRATAWSVFGTLYMAGSLARMAIGAALPAAPAWFHSWIPAAFHSVLAAYVLTLAYYYRNAR